MELFSNTIYLNILKELNNWLTEIFLYSYIKLSNIKLIIYLFYIYNI